MAGAADRPLVFLDVDGPLIPFRARPVGRRIAVGHLVGSSGGNPLVGRLDPEDGRRLLALRCRLVWASTWMADANEVIAPRLGLPPLPVVDFPEGEADPGLHWKTVHLVRWAAGRPFVWLDDETTEADRRWVRDHHPGRALVHRVDPLVGLTDRDFARVRQWLAVV